MTANVVTEASDRSARIEKMATWRRRAGCCERVTVDGGRLFAARRAVRRTCVVRPATSRIWPENRAKGRLFVCAVAPGSRGAMRLGRDVCWGLAKEVSDGDEWAWREW